MKNCKPYVRLAFTDRNEDGKVELLGDASEITQQNDFYPFGMVHSGEGVFHGGNGGNRFKYNGKEQLNELGLYDYGARWYDAAVGRWGQVDPKSDLQESVTPYAYSLNSPVLYIDPDGSLPILINGRTASDSERGDKSYWAQQLLNTISNSGIPNPGGQLHFTDGNVGFGKTDLGMGRMVGPARVNREASSAFKRRRAGRAVAQQEFSTILSKLERDPESGLITEHIQIYSHSRGGAFAQGFTEELLVLIEANADKFSDPNAVIDFGLHLAPHQSNAISGANGVDNYSISHVLDGLSGNDMGNSTNFHSSVGNLKTAHTNATFSDEVSMFLQSIQANGGDRDGTVRDFLQNVRASGISITVQ